MSSVSRLVGVHVTPDQRIDLLVDPNDPNHILARVESLHLDDVPVDVPSGSSQNSYLSSPAKVSQLVTSGQLEPVYSEGTKSVSFVPIPQVGRTWENGGELSMPSDAIWINRSDGSLAYAFVNTVTHWNWVENRTDIIGYPVEAIKALGEAQDGSLIVGDNAGRLHTSKGVLETGTPEAITSICFVNETHCLISFEKADPILFDFVAKIPTMTLKGRCFRIDAGVFISIGDRVTVHKYIPSEQRYNSEEFRSDINPENAKIYGTKVFSPLEDNKVVCCDVLTSSSVCFKNQDISRAIIRGNFVVLDSKAFAIGDSSGRNAEIVFYSLEDGLKKGEVFSGSWGVDAITLLSDGTIMYGTDTSPSGIHVVTRDEQVLFSDRAIVRNRKIKTIRELPRGAVVIDFTGTLLVLNPKITPPTPQPDQLSVYHSQAKQTDDPEKKYRIFLSGLQAAIKFTNLYQARRFYKEARKIKPGNPEVCQIFLSYLRSTPYKKLRKQVRLDLFAITRNQDDIRELQGKRYKKRLFVGEGTFNFTEAYLKKHVDSHRGIESSIIATELMAPQAEATKQRVSSLMRQGVTVLFGIDAQRLHELFRGKRFERIHWNCPFGGATSAERVAFKDVVTYFFQSSRELQIKGDRIHLTLVQSGDGYRQKEHSLVSASAGAGYRLIRKRAFGADRYPGYEHLKTSQTEKYDAGGIEREFVFEKTGKSFERLTVQNVKELMRGEEKEYTVKTDGLKPGEEPLLSASYFECSTDESSSDGFESD